MKPYVTIHTTKTCVAFTFDTDDTMIETATFDEDNEPDWTDATVADNNDVLDAVSDVLEALDA